MWQIHVQSEMPGLVARRSLNSFYPEDASAGADDDENHVAAAFCGLAWMTEGQVGVPLDGPWHLFNFFWKYAVFPGLQVWPCVFSFFFSGILW